MNRQMIDVAKGISMQHSRLRTKGYHCPIQWQELWTLGQNKLRKAIL